MIEIVNPTEGIWVDTSGSETVSLQFHRTGLLTHTCIITRPDGSQILAKTSEGDFREGFYGLAWELPNESAPYPNPGRGFPSGTYLFSDLTLPGKE